jgi:DNA-binding CsgD family transcriptional regulator
MNRVVNERGCNDQIHGRSAKAVARFAFSHFEIISLDNLPPLFPLLSDVAGAGYRMKGIRRNQLPREPILSSPLACRELYFFQERNTGLSRFQVAAGPKGQFPVEEAAALLAMHCMVLGQSPQDYVVTVCAAQESLAGLSGKVKKLLQAGYSVRSSVKLTRRQEEVLRGVMRSLANKEIAGSLNLSERTVKFHITSLLAKFCVRSRSELAREAARRTLGPMAVPQSLTIHNERTYAEVRPNHGAPHVRPITINNRHLRA